MRLIAQSSNSGKRADGRTLRLASAGAITSAAFALPLGDAGGLRRRRAFVFIHPLISHASEEQDLCAAAIVSRTTGCFRRLQADDVAHGNTHNRESILQIAPNLGEGGLIFGQRYREAIWLIRETAVEAKNPSAIRIVRSLPGRR